MAFAPLVPAFAAPSALESNAGRIDIPTGSGGVSPPPEFLPREPASLAFAFDRVHHNPDEAPDEVATFTATAGRMAGLSLSAGAVWWVLRAGGLLSSLLASAPAWRHLDPLPILGRSDEDENVDWGVEDAEAKRQEQAAQQVLATKPAMRRASP